MNRLIIFVSTLLLLGTAAQAQQGRRLFRTPFVSYDIRTDAQADRRHASQMYAPVLLSAAGDGVYSGILTVPENWLDRRIILHIEPNAGAMRIYVNGSETFTASDSRSGAEIDITDAVGFGTNSIVAEMADLPESRIMEHNLKSAYSTAADRLWVSAQPIISIYDYSVAAVRDTTGRDGVLSLEIAVRNGFRTEETFNVGYDIYTPDGKLRNYNITEISVPRLSTDTVRFTEAVWSAGKWLWSADRPNLYKVMLYIKYGGKVIEYLPLTVGFADIDFSEQGLLVNGQKTAVSAVRYNAPSQTDAEQKMLAFKRRGINTICVDYPQPSWFYRMCDRKGFYVIDCAAIHADAKNGDRGTDGSAANNPEYLNEFLDRTRSMYSRNRNHRCVIGWSLGSDSGNGYNMYKAYMQMKSADSVRPVTYCGADGEWNSDIAPVDALSLEQAMKIAPRRR